VTEVIFECENPRGSAGYRRVGRREYYEGDYQILPGATTNVRIEKGLESTYSIINLRSSSPLKYRRNWQHIRRDKADVSVLWFVKRGSIIFSQGGGKKVVKAGQCTVSRSLQPYQMDCLVDDDSQHEVLHVVAPTHLLSAAIPDTVKHGTTFSCHQGNGHLALRTFELLYEEGALASQKAADGLAREAIGAIGAIFTATKDDAPRSVSDKRFADLVAFMERHLGNPSLSADMVARGIGVSYRYLLHILKAHDTSFSDILWNGRLERAQTWLAADDMKHLPISQISYMAGFKSAAHFSRMFKSATKTSPSDFRKAQGHA
jgi:AraC-like DNA-binding protein